ncbi:MAG: SWIM zinc finger family protein [Bacteroidales bacterium]|nr:SWIM zinc finger family protein [Bacteroidales bacterium]
MVLSEDQIFTLAPDAASLKAGKDLAVISKWQLRGTSDKAIWGHCQGSGKLPYQTQVDLQNIAFKCTCPSRKFPCKHGLGLLLLYSREPGTFTRGEEPAWVADWLKRRTEKETVRSAKEKKPVDAESQAKRAGARIKKVSGGIDDLQVWLKDLVRNGLIILPERAFEYWQNPAKRMIDAQAPGLAAMIRALGNINYYNESWKQEVLKLLSKIYLVTEGYRHLDSLPENMQHEVRSLVGFTQGKDDLLKQNGIKDNWLVLSRTFEEDEQVTIERNWLYGINHKKFALILQFFVSRQVPEFNFVPGTTLDAELVYYQGVHNYRALVKDLKSTGGSIMPEFIKCTSNALENYSNVIAENPFINRVPLLLEDVRFYKNNNQNYLIDHEDYGLKLKISEETAIQMLALSGGKQFGVFLLIDEDEAEPLALWINNNFFSLSYAVQK